MPAAGEDSGRRSVVPQAAGRSLWFAAAWTGVGTALVGAVVAVVAVAICWLPTAASSGHSRSAIRAGLLTFLAALHGGITVDGTSAAFLPLGLSIAVVALAWRAGAALADVAAELGERDPLRVAYAGAAQTVCFALACVVAVPFATLGTSHAPVLGVVAAALVLFAIASGASLACNSAPLRGWCASRLSARARLVTRAATAAALVYLAAGAVLVAGSLVMHHGRVQALSAQVGGGWSGAPVLLLGILAAPNAVIAAASYLAGPGFAVGAGSTVSMFGATHATLPAFPILGAVPDGGGTPIAAWLLSALSGIGAGLLVARLVRSSGPLRESLQTCLATALAAGAGMFLLAWQAGGGIGSGRLHTVGASPWQFGGAVAGTLTLVSAAGVALPAAWRRWAERRGALDTATEEPHRPLRVAAVLPDEAAAEGERPAGDTGEPGALAG